MKERVFYIFFVFVIIIFHGCNYDHRSKKSNVNHANKKINDFGTPIISKAKTGIIKQYYDNGKVSSEFTYQNGVKKGEMKTYYPNGNIRTKGYLLNDTTLNGEYFIYDTSGRLYKKILYKDGKQIYP